MPSLLERWMFFIMASTSLSNFASVAFSSPAAGSLSLLPPFWSICCAMLDICMSAVLNHRPPLRTLSLRLRPCRFSCMCGSSAHARNIRQLPRSGGRAIARDWMDWLMPVISPREPLSVSSHIVVVYCGQVMPLEIDIAHGCAGEEEEEHPLPAHPVRHRTGHRRAQELGQGIACDREAEEGHPGKGLVTGGQYALVDAQ